MWYFISGIYWCIHTLCTARSKRTKRFLGGDGSYRFGSHTLTGLVLSHDSVLIVRVLIDRRVPVPGIQDQTLGCPQEAVAVALTTLHVVATDWSTAVVARWVPFKGDGVLGDFNGFQVAWGIRYVWKEVQWLRRCIIMALSLRVVSHISMG